MLECLKSDAVSLSWRDTREETETENSWEGISRMLIQIRLFLMGSETHRKLRLYGKLNIQKIQADAFDLRKSVKLPQYEKTLFYLCCIGEEEDPPTVLRSLYHTNWFQTEEMLKTVSENEKRILLTGINLDSFCQNLIKKRDIHI